MELMEERLQFNSRCPICGRTTPQPQYTRSWLIEHLETDVEVTARCMPCDKPYSVPEAERRELAVRLGLKLKHK